MVPAPLNLSRSPRLFYTAASLATRHIPNLVSRVFQGYNDTATTAAGSDFPLNHVHVLVKREQHDAKFIAFAVLIPVLVLLSGLFAGLTLGYMSLDETQLHVLITSGTPTQKAYAKKILPVRKNGHLLLVTLLLANMIANETLPVVCDPILGGGVYGVLVSTVLIVIFSEIIPQSLCTRYGLAIGANMAPMVQILIYALGIVSWPVAKLLELILGPHHGIMYRRGELKELIALHETTGHLGGDLKQDTVTIIGATLDLQEKVVQQAMTPIENVFMLSIDCKLDHDTMKRICDTGHSRVPVYEEVEIPVQETADVVYVGGANTMKAKKIIGILLVKQCVMLDAKDATPLRNLQLLKPLTVWKNMSLLHILDKFQTGHTHMAVVSRLSEEKAASVMHIKRKVKKGLTQRLKDRVMGDSSDDSGSDTEGEEGSDEGTEGSEKDTMTSKKQRKWRRGRKQKKAKGDVEQGNLNEKTKVEETKSTWSALGNNGREQAMPADAVLAKESADEYLRNLGPEINPLGIITLEDVLEELIGEEIYDEFDAEGRSQLTSYAPTKRRRPQVESSPSAPAVVVHPGPAAAPEVGTQTPSRPVSLAPLSALVSSKISRVAQGTGMAGRLSRKNSRQRVAAAEGPEGVEHADGEAEEQVDHPKGEEDIRIPGAKDKEGPDKESEGKE